MMASKAIGSSLRYVAKRGYAAVCPAQKQPEISNNTLGNKVIVAAYDTGAPVHRVTVAFKAGSRYEPTNEAGASHLLRAAAGLTTSKISSFIIHRKLAQLGAAFSASSDREFIYYTVEATGAHLDEVLEVLAGLVSCQEFRPWELSEIQPRLAYDTASLAPQVRAMDLLHKAAYRRGLGNSLYMSPRRIGKMSSESLQHFATSCLALDRCAVTVVGCNLDRATCVANMLRVAPSTAGHSEPTKYYGGEQRKEMGGDLSHVALALPGAVAGTKESLALAVAAKALGNGPMAKWGTDNSCLGRILDNVRPAAAAGFSVNYSDSGLFGVVLSVPTDASDNATRIVAKQLKSLSFDANAVQSGKNQLKLAVLSEAEAGTACSESLAAAALYGGARSVQAPIDIAKEIDLIDVNAVNAAVSKATSGRLSMGAVGNLSNTPFVDEL